MPIKTVVRIMVLLLAAAILALPALAQPDIAEINLSHLRIVNALVGLGPVDVYVDGERVAFRLEPEGATPYLSIPAGKHSIAVRPPDSDPLTAPVADTQVDLAPNQSETAIAYQNQFATEGFVPNFEQVGAFFVVDDDRSPIELGKTRLTAVHLAIGAPQVLSLAYPSRESLLHQVALGQPYGTVDIDAHLYSLALVDAASPELSVLARLGDFSFYASTLYNVIIVPDLQPSPDGVPRVQGAVPTPRAFILSAPIDPPEDGVRLRLIHAAPNTAVLDLYIDGRLVAERMNYSRVTEYLGLWSYSHVITLRRVGDGPQDTPLGQAEFTITAENRQQRYWTLMLLNAAGADTTAALPLVSGGSQQEPQTIINASGSSLFMVLLPDNIAQTRQGYARVRLVNAVNDIPSLRVLAKTVPAPPLPGTRATPVPPPNATPTPPLQLVEDVVFAAEANESEVPAGMYPELNFVPAGTSNTLTTLTDVQLVQGMVYTYVAMGSPVGNPPISVVGLSDYGTGLPLDRLYMGRITAQSANIRNAASPSGGILTQLSRDTEVEVLGRNLSGEWIRIRFSHPASGVTQEGWISAVARIIEVTRLGVPVNALALPRYIAPGG